MIPGPFSTVDTPCGTFYVPARELLVRDKTVEQVVDEINTRMHKKKKKHPNKPVIYITDNIVGYSVEK